MTKEGIQAKDPGGSITGEVGLRIHGKSVKMQLTVPAGPIKPQRMLPVFQQLTNSFVKMGTDEAEANGKTISCKAGCGACCRQAIPLTEVEVYHIAELVNAMPEPKRTEVRQRFSAGLEHFNSIGWFDRMQSIADRDQTREAYEEEMKIAAIDYFDQGIPCPFLEKNACSIYPDRPLVCREYLVTSPAVDCSKPRPETIARVPLPVLPSKTLQKVAASGKLPSLITMVQALEFADKYPENFEEKTGERWAAEFFGKLSHGEIPDPGKVVP
jgi:Fe-S-cluster containining protein